MNANEALTFQMASTMAKLVEGVISRLDTIIDRLAIVVNKVDNLDTEVGKLSTLLKQSAQGTHTI